MLSCQQVPIPLQGGLLGGLSTVTPSRSRHGSTIEALGQQSAGCMFRALLPRTMMRACHKELQRKTGNQAENQDEDDYRVQVRKKTEKALKHCSSTKIFLHSTVLSWIMSPVDHLWQRLQADKHPVTLCDVVRDQNPFKKCSTLLANVLLHPPESGPVAVLWKHWSGVIEDELLDWLVMQICQDVAAMVCQIYFRFDIVWKAWPFPLASMVDTEGGTDAYVQSELVYEKFMKAPKCCLDEHFGSKLRDLWEACGEEHHTHDAFRARYLTALQCWAHNTKITNMHVERLLSQCKSSSSDKVPSVERLLCSSYLSQWLSLHKKAGGLGPGESQHRKELIAAGVPLASKKGNQSQSTKASSGLFTYVHQHAAKSRLTGAARAAEKRRWRQGRCFNSTLTFLTPPPSKEVLHRVTSPHSLLHDNET